MQRVTAELTDEEVVRRVLAGETSLYELLVRRYNQRLYRTARAILRDGDEAEEVMQEAYVRAYHHLHQFAGEAKFSTWLTRITVHAALARLRSRDRWRPLESRPESDGASLMSTLSSASNPERDTYEREFRAVLEGAIDSLPEIYRTVFVLRVVEGLEGPETAESLDITLDAVKMRLHRAKSLLRRKLYRQLGESCRQAFAFHLTRCDRVTAAVIAQIPPTPFR